MRPLTLHLVALASLLFGVSLFVDKETDKPLGVPATPAKKTPLPPSPEPKPKPQPKPKPCPGPWGPKPCPSQGGDGLSPSIEQILRRPLRPMPQPGPNPEPQPEPGPSIPGKPGRPVIGGRVSPDGKVELTCDLPASERKKNIASKGLGCCVFRSADYAGRWQIVPELYDLPEKMKKAGIAGGGYPEKVDEVFAKFAPGLDYIQYTSGDAEVLEAILKTGRMACVTYCGHDPHHGNQTIAHMVNLVCFDRASGWSAIADNNFTGQSDFVWMSCEEFLKRWRGGGGGGWCYCLLSPPPPPVPHN